MLPETPVVGSLAMKEVSEETLAMAEPKQEPPTPGIPEQETPEHETALEVEEAPEQEQGAMVETPTLEQATGLESRPGELQAEQVTTVVTNWSPRIRDFHSLRLGTNLTLTPPHPPALVISRSCDSQIICHPVAPSLVLLLI
ncbi:hypothetical protein J6590_082379 [Homalodisca vitripennis]|nr:hypothetical protein J6590_082379 [Homalodisca vitripennis]